MKDTDFFIAILYEFLEHFRVLPVVQLNWAGGGTTEKLDNSCNAHDNYV